MTRQEIGLAERLIESGVTRAEAVLAIAMYSRGHARPELEIVDLARQYPGLSGPGVAELALSALRRRGWVIEQDTTNRVTICLAAQEFPRMLAELVQDEKFAETLEILRADNRPTVQVLGRMHDPGVYETFGTRIRAATNEVLLFMINTTPRLVQVADMQAAARSGVSVKILMAAPTLAARIRGRTSLAESRKRVQGWLENSRGLGQFEIKVTSRASDLWLASSVCIDGTTTRIDVFDPVVQRTTQGTMIEVLADTQTNLALIFREHFNDAWRRGRKPGWAGAVASAIRRFWLPVGSVAALTVAITSTNAGSFAVAFTSGVVTGLISNYLPKVPDVIGNIVSRFRR